LPLQLKWLRVAANIFVGDAGVLAVCAVTSRGRLHVRIRRANPSEAWLTCVVFSQPQRAPLSREDAYEQLRKSEETIACLTPRLLVLDRFVRPHHIDAQAGCGDHLHAELGQLDPGGEGTQLFRGGGEDVTGRLLPDRAIPRPGIVSQRVVYERAPEQR
jgi:hypothetical protein